MKIVLWSYYYPNCRLDLDSHYLGVTAEEPKEHTGKYHVKEINAVTFSDTQVSLQVSPLDDDPNRKKKEEEPAAVAGVLDTPIQVPSPVVMAPAIDEDLVDEDLADEDLADGVPV